jgi:hypothetical protein
MTILSSIFFSLSYQCIASSLTNRQDIECPISLKVIILKHLSHHIIAFLRDKALCPFLNPKNVSILKVTYTELYMQADISCSHLLFAIHTCRCAYD